MPRVAGVLCALSVAGLLGSVQARAQAAVAEPAEKRWSLSVGVDAAEIYLFRGLDLLADEPVATPYVVARFGGGFSAYYYGYNGDLGQNGPPYTEDDVGLDYTFAVGKMSLTLGGLAYTYRDPNEYEGLDTTELYAIAAFDTLLSPKVSYWHDIDLYDGGYLQLAVSHTWDVGHGVSVVPSAALGVSLGWTERVFANARDQQWNDFLLGVNVPWQITDQFAVHLQVQHSFALDALDDGNQGDENLWIVGGSYTF